MDKNLTNEGTQGLTRNLRHLANLRRKPANNRLSVRPQLIQSALLPLGMGMMGSLSSMQPIKEERESAASTAQNTFRQPTTAENSERHENNEHRHVVHFSLDTIPSESNLKRNDYDPDEDIPFFDLSSRR